MKVQIYEHLKRESNEFDVRKITLIINEKEYDIAELENGIRLSVDGQLDILPRATNVVHIFEIW